MCGDCGSNHDEPITPNVEQEEQIVRETYILINSQTIETDSTNLKDGSSVELIDKDNFCITKRSMDDIKQGQWFVFVEPTDVCNTRCVSVNPQGNFIYLCVRNNKNGSIDAKTLSMERDEKLEIVGRINKMLEEAI